MTKRLHIPEFQTDDLMPPGVFVAWGGKVDPAERDRWAAKVLAEVDAELLAEFQTLIPFPGLKAEPPPGILSQWGLIDGMPLQAVLEAEFPGVAYSWSKHEYEYTLTSVLEEDVILYVSFTPCLTVMHVAGIEVTNAEDAMGGYTTFAALVLDFKSRIRSVTTAARKLGISEAT